MENKNSRIITHPSQVEKKNNHTVLIVDVDDSDIENIGLFCMSSEKNYDIYLYDETVNDLEWLSTISKNVDKTLVNSISKVTVNDTNFIRYGKETALKNPLDYFINFDKKSI